MHYAAGAHQIIHLSELQLWVFGHDLQNQSCSSVHSTGLALVVLLVSVPGIRMKVNRVIC